MSLKDQLQQVLDNASKEITNVILNSPECEKAIKDQNDRIAHSLTSAEAVLIQRINEIKTELSQRLIITG